MTDAQLEKFQARKEKEFRGVIMTKDVKKYNRINKNGADGYTEIVYNNGSRFYCKGPLVDNVGLG